MERRSKHIARRLIATNLRKLRAVRDMTQEDLAAAAGVDRTYISMLENERKAASADVLEAFANVFGLEPYEMLHPNTPQKIGSEDKDGAHG